MTGGLCGAREGCWRGGSGGKVCNYTAWRGGGGSLESWTAFETGCRDSDVGRGCLQFFLNL